MEKSDLEIWLASDNARIAVRAAHKLNAAARVLGTTTGQVDTGIALNSDEEKAYTDMLALMDRLAGRPSR